MSRIVITSCSKRKICDDRLLPAIHRYDGPGFRLLRRYLREQAEPLDIFVLSAKFGLVSHKKRIPFYEQTLTKDNVDSLAAKVSGQAHVLFDQSSAPKHVFVNLGRVYLDAFEQTINQLTLGSCITLASGPSGRRLSELHDWLYGEQSKLRNQPKRIDFASTANFRGIPISADEASIQALVMEGIEEGHLEAVQNFQSWYLEVSGLKVSIKWVVSKLTGIEVGKFHSDQARRLLEKLGIRVRRV